MGDLQIDITQAGQNNEVTVITPRGYIDTTTVEDLEKKLRDFGDVC